jgi:hypothetical protein
MTAAAVLHPEILKAVILHASPKTSDLASKSMIECVKMRRFMSKLENSRKSTRHLMSVHDSVCLFSFLRNREIQRLYLILQLKGPSILPSVTHRKSLLDRK